MESDIIMIAQKGLYLVLYLSAAPVLAALIVGLLISIMQATTQVQEQTLTFVPKLVIIVLILMLFGPAGMRLLMDFTKVLFESIAKVTQGS